MLQELPSFAAVTATDLNKVIRAVRQAADIKAAPPLEIARTDGGTQIRLTDSSFMAAITRRIDTNDTSSSSMSSALHGSHNRWMYEVQEVIPDGNGKWVYRDEGRVLDNDVQVWEWNDNKVAVGTVVEVLLFGNNDWRFEHCCALGDSSSSSSSRSSSSTSVSSVSSSSTSGSSVSSTSSVSGSSSSSTSSSSGSSSSSKSSSSTSSSSVSSSSRSSDSDSSQSNSSTSNSSTSDSSQSGSSDSSDDCHGTAITLVTGLSYDSVTCKLTVTTTRVCIPPCISVEFSSGSDVTTRTSSDISGGGD